MQYLEYDQDNYWTEAIMVDHSIQIIIQILRDAFLDIKHFSSLIMIYIILL